MSQRHSASIFFSLTLVICLSLYISASDRQKQSRSPASENSCINVLSQVLAKNVDPADVFELTQTVQKSLLAIDIDYISGTTVPGRKQLDEILEISQLFDTVMKHLGPLSHEEITQYFDKTLLSLPFDYARMDRLVESVNNQDSFEKLQLADLEWITYFQKTYQRIQRVFPKKYQVSFEFKKVLEKRRSITKQAINLLKKQDEHMNRLFPTTNYSDINNFSEEIDQLEHKWDELIDIIRNEKVEIAMHQPEGIRHWISNLGFYNQHVTHTSKGSLSNSGRHTVESTFTGSKYDDYQQLDNDLKPKYGLLRPRPDSSFKPWYELQFGRDIYIFKLDNIRDRLTWYPGDSLRRVISTKMSMPEWKQGMSYKPTAWDQLFIPWNKRELMIPMYMSKISDERLFALSSYSYSPHHYFENLTSKGSPYGKFIEWQIWGPLRISDVEKFIFTTKPPTGDFLKSLIDHGIKIFDGRNAPYRPEKPWVTPKR